MEECVVLKNAVFILVLKQTGLVKRLGDHLFCTQRRSELTSPPRVSCKLFFKAKDHTG